MSRKQKAQTIADVINRRRDRLISREEWRSLLVRAATMLIAGYIVFTQVFLLTQMSGMGMFPAMKDGDLAVVFRLQEEYERDDIVAYRVGGGRYFGRIVASEHDVVTLDESGTLYVNGTAQSGEIMYPTYPKEGMEYPFRVPEGHIFVMGDYRTQTEDSRDFGSIPMEQVEGKLITILRRREL